MDQMRTYLVTAYLRSDSDWDMRDWFIRLAFLVFSDMFLRRSAASVGSL